MKKIGRNEKCPCGSGKKYKKCCMNKFPRDQYIYFGHKEKFEGLSISDNGEGSITINGKKEKSDAVFSQIKYTGLKERMIMSISGSAVTNIPYYLYTNFNFVYAIDTNTKLIENNYISVGSITESFFGNNINIQHEVSFYYRKLGNILFKNCPGDLREKFSWFKLIELLNSNPKNSNLKFGVITDYDEENHIRYNNKEIPLVKDFYLPDNFKIFYARSNTGKENIPNMLIHECDKDANRILKEFEENKFIIFNKRKILVDNIPNFTKVIYL